MHVELKARNYARATESLKAQGGLEDKITKSQFVSPLEGKISSKYGVRISPFHNDLRFHKGIDIAAEHGSVVRSCSAGIVQKISYDSMYGKYIEILSGKYLLRYAHLSEVFLEQGERVRQASSLGLVGTTGRTTGPHLHLEVYKNNKAVDPKKIIQELN